ncbi:tetracycline resistance [Fusarium albosuccineum]|uniref:Tetracycline resistance n=1 Tax=Fusarium albosuccineum TaxID=1237068 RepID=A0A8H4LBP4_9HYPO|nr:tetracycline resistance [Fusarium albosuccineum]
MAPIFHQFSRLPAELRMQIWEEACFPRHLLGIHYFALDERKELIFNPSSYLSKRSASCWDGGLWMACKESRAVVGNHSQIEKWNKVRLRADRECKNPGRLVGKEEAIPGVVATQEGHEARHLMVYPSQDIFCVTANNTNWESLLSSWDVKNIALEFEPSWILDFPRDLFDLNDGKSSRGFLAQVLINMALSHSWSAVFWLIDKSARWRARPDRDISTVFSDSDGEYVEIDWSEIYSGGEDESDIRSDGDYESKIQSDAECESPIVQFINKLAEFDEQIWLLLIDGLIVWGDIEASDWWRYTFSIKESIRLLVRRDNQVTGHLD